MSRFAALLLVALALRLFFAVAFWGNVDQQHYEEIAAILRNGGNVYAESRYYNYAPPFAHLIGFGDMVSARTGIPLHTVLRSFLSLIDVANGLLLGAIVRRGLRTEQTFSPQSSVPNRFVERGAALAYLFNPAIVLIVGFNGQIETLALAPVLAAICLVAMYGSAHFEA